jgi:hypothetical protein
VFGSCRGAISRFGNAIGSLRRNSFAGFALGVAFLEFRHVQIMARNFEIALAHVKTRRGFGKVEVFRCAIAISTRPHPKTEFAYGFAIRHFATHKMQHERNTDWGEANGTQLSRGLAFRVYRDSVKRPCG